RVLPRVLFDIPNRYQFPALRSASLRLALRASAPPYRAEKPSVPREVEWDGRHKPRSEISRPRIHGVALGPSPRADVGHECCELAIGFPPSAGEGSTCGRIGRCRTF